MKETRTPPSENMKVVPEKSREQYQQLLFLPITTFGCNTVKYVEFSDNIFIFSSISMYELRRSVVVKNSNNKTVKQQALGGSGDISC